MRFWRSRWTELPLSLRASVLCVLVGLTLAIVVVPVAAQTVDQPVHIEQVVVGWTGLIALIGLVAQWGFRWGELRTQTKQREEEAAQEKVWQDGLEERLRRIEDKKVDRRELVEALRRLDVVHEDIKATNQRFDRFLERQE